MRLGIRGKLFLVSLALIGASVIVAYFYVRDRLEYELTERVRKELIVRAELVALGVQSSSAGFEEQARWHELASDLGKRGKAQVTLFGAKGELLADSRGEQAYADHRERPELTAALSGAHVAYSTSPDGHTLFVAVPFSRANQFAGIARVGLPLTEVDIALADLRNTLTIATILALACAIVMSSIAAQVASRTARALIGAARKMAEGDLSARTRMTGGDEFGELGRTLDQLARNLSKTLGELRSERDRLEGILVGMQEGVMLLDEHCRISVLNPALREMLLLGADSVGKTVLEVVRHAELKELLDLGRRSLEPVSREIELSGIKPRRLLVRVAQLPGERTQLFAVMVDVTEVRRLESLRREFVANVSHELRTPVTAIRTAAETLQDGVPSDIDVTRRFIGIIERNATRLHDLVEDLLDLSRIESRGFKFSMEALDLRAVYSHVLSLFREPAEQKDIRVVETLPVNLPPAWADRRALEHVLTNLVDNAVKYCPSGCKVTLSAVDTGKSVSLTVEDNGPGIESRHLPRIFERFYRVDAGRSRELGGTGLGLSIVKHLVEGMGGSVRVESTPGVGTKFSVNLKKPESEETRAVA